MASPLLERSKIQAQVLVPVLRAFRAAIGTERANAAKPSSPASAPSKADALASSS
jgi:hypothetical protein